MYRNIVPQNKCLSYFVVTVIKHYGQSNLGIKYLFCCTVQGYNQSRQEVLELEVVGHMAFTSRKQRTMNVVFTPLFHFYTVQDPSQRTSAAYSGQVFRPQMIQDSSLRTCLRHTSQVILDLIKITAEITCPNK